MNTQYHSTLPPSEAPWKLVGFKGMLLAMSATTAPVVWSPQLNRWVPLNQPDEPIKIHHDWMFNA